MRPIRILAALGLTATLAACVQGKDFVRDDPDTPLAEGLYEFCEEARGATADEIECTPTYLFLDEATYVYASREGTTGQARFSEVADNLFILYNRNAPDFYGYGAMRIEPSGEAVIYRFDCERIEETMGVGALIADGMLAPRPKEAGVDCRIETKAQYDAFVRLVRRRSQDMSNPDGVFRLKLVRADTF